MREKFLAHGKEVFHSHELLEMLLYYVIPQKNTNEIAKELISRFSSLDGVFSQPVSELVKVRGVGEKIAEFIVSVGKLDINSILSEENESHHTFESYTELGSFFADYFGSSDKYSVAIMLLNSKMEYIACETVYDVDYGSASVKAERFINLAIKERASVVALAHNHPFGPMYPTPSDIETNKAILESFERADILLIEHYIVSGKSYVGFMNHLGTAFSQAHEISRFLSSKEGAR